MNEAKNAEMNKMKNYEYDEIRYVENVENIPPLTMAITHHSHEWVSIVVTDEIGGVVYFDGPLTWDMAHEREIELWGWNNENL